MAVLKVMIDGSRYGFDIMDSAGLPSGTVYPILRRLDREGLLESSWEDATEAQKAQRPPRRYYAITADGERMLADAVNRYHTLEQAIARASARASRA